MNANELSSYPPLIAELLRQAPLAPLGPGSPVREVRSKLESVASAFPSGADSDMAAACRAGLWLAYNFHEHRGTDSEQELLLRRVQQREGELLFDWCFRRGAIERADGLNT